MLLDLNVIFKDKWYLICFELDKYMKIHSWWAKGKVWDKNGIDMNKDQNLPKIKKTRRDTDMYAPWLRWEVWDKHKNITNRDATYIHSQRDIGVF